MLRIVLMVLRNLPFVPYWWWQLCHTAKNPEAYSEQERWALLQKITTHANKGGRVIIESRNTEKIPESESFMFFPNHQGL